jgi:hypothetical protein
LEIGRSGEGFSHVLLPHWDEPVSDDLSRVGDRDDDVLHRAHYQTAPLVEIVIRFEKVFFGLIDDLRKPTTPDLNNWPCGRLRSDPGDLLI